MIQYRDLSPGELSPELFAAFVRRQVVTDCWRREGEEWVIRKTPFIDDWSAEDIQTLVSCLRNTLNTGGLVRAAFLGGALKGFVSVEPTLFGGEHRYLDLSSIHVSQELRGSGTGRALFSAAADWARARGAKKLYISAHSAVETQAFYRGLGCVDAQLPDPHHMEAEPFDCQLEYTL
jgi:GNAT superfamily N-acetyltransferase